MAIGLSQTQGSVQVHLCKLQYLWVCTPLSFHSFFPPPRPPSQRTLPWLAPTSFLRQPKATHA
jgi:hypothetical protein